MTALERIKNHLNVGGPHLGDLIWWGLADARVSRATLEQVWAGAGLDPAHLPEPPTPEKAMKMAARAAALGQADRLVRLGKQDEAEIVFTVVREHREEDGSLKYSQEARVVLERRAEAVSTDSPGHDLAEAIRGRYAELKDTHPSDDIRRALMNVLAACSSVCLRDHGGVYWVPSPHSATVRNLQAAVERIGSSRVYLLPVHASADANKTLGDAAKIAIEDELASLKAEVDGFLAAPPERTSTLIRRLDAFATLRERAELYKSILSVHIADLDGTLDALTQNVEMLLDRKAAA